MLPKYCDNNIDHGSNLTIMIVGGVAILRKKYIKNVKYIISYCFIENNYILGSTVFNYCLNKLEVLFWHCHYDNT